MPERPWFKFYPSDWRGDVNLRACSPRARAVWIEMLCLMEVAQPYGHLIVAGRALTDDALAQQAGMSPTDVRAGLTELEAAGVFNRESDGTIYSRRMVRTEELRRRRAEGGWKSTNNPNVPQPKDTSKDALDGYPSRGSPGPKDILEGSPQIPDTRYQKPETKKPEVASPTRGESGSPQRRPRQETWLTPFASEWEARYGGRPSLGRTARALFPLFKQHGADAVLESWRHYLADTPARYAAPEKFAQTFGVWSGDGGRTAGSGRRSNQQDTNLKTMDEWAASAKAREASSGEH